MSDRPTITLCMIVKDEEHVIKRCLESIYKYIDRYDISDTGSTDKTKEIIKEFFDEKGIPGEVHEIPWEGFGKSRTQALRNCDGKADYAWMIDADDSLEGDFTQALDFIDKTRFSSYSLKIGRGRNFTWWRNQIFKTEDRWRYVGVLHEYADCDDRQTKKMSQIHSDYFVHARTEGARNVGVTPEEKYLKDAAVLEDALLNPDSQNYDPTNDRYHFYLAQSYFDAGKYDKAKEWYEKRVKMGGWEEEAFYSLYRVGICSGLLEEPWEKTLMYFMMAWDARPWRAEPLHQISRVFRLNGKPRLAYLYATQAAKIPYPTQDILFLASDIYEWMCLDEITATAFYVGEFEQGLDACNRLLSENKLPSDQIPRIKDNKNQYILAIQNRNDKIKQQKKMQEQVKRELKLTPNKSSSKSYKKKKKGS